MRIRKRQLPFPVADLNPRVQLRPQPYDTTPQQERSCLFQDLLSQDDEGQRNLSHYPQPSDRPNSSFSLIGDWDHDAVRKDERYESLFLQVEEEGKGESVGAERNNDAITNTWKEAEAVIGGAVGGAAAGQVRPLPLKKRRGSYGTAATEEEEHGKLSLMENCTSNKTSMKTKMNNKNCGIVLQLNDGSRENQETRSGGGKKRGRGPGGGVVAMEGSRCSRVNGRGWRCSQKTLVGYSLCEHHLGKGTRPRRGISIKEEDSTPLKYLEMSSISSSPSSKLQDDEPPKKAMKKLRMVKARSLSSLLGQTNEASLAVEEEDFINVSWGVSNDITQREEL